MVIKRWFPPGRCCPKPARREASRLSLNATESRRTRTRALSPTPSPLGVHERTVLRLRMGFNRHTVCPRMRGYEGAVTCRPVLAKLSTYDPSSAGASSHEAPAPIYGWSRRPPLSSYQKAVSGWLASPLRGSANAGRYGRRPQAESSGRYRGRGRHRYDVSREPGSSCG